MEFIHVVLLKGNDYTNVYNKIKKVVNIFIHKRFETVYNIQKMEKQGVILLEMFVLILPYVANQQLEEWEVRIETNDFQFESMSLSTNNVQFNQIYFQHHYIPQILLDFHRQKLIVFLERYDRNIIEALLSKMALITNNSMLFLSRSKKKST